MRLYHYLKSRHALENVSKRRLKIARFADLNDPFELVAAKNSDEVQRKILRSWKNAHQNRWGLLCFSRTWRNPLMWSHYGDKHKGMCLGFDVDDEYTMPVRYTSKRIDVDLVALEARGLLNAQLMNRFLRTKFIDWRYEKEVRVSAELNVKDREKGKYFYNFGENVELAEIIVGPVCRISRSDVRQKLHGRYSNVKLVKARLAFKTFRIVEDQRGLE